MQTDVSKFDSVSELPLCAQEAKGGRVASHVLDFVSLNEMKIWGSRQLQSRIKSEIVRSD